MSSCLRAELCKVEIPDFCSRVIGGIGDCHVPFLLNSGEQWLLEDPSRAIEMKKG